MKSQQGFAVFAGAAWLAAAAFSGGFIAAVEHGTDKSAPAQMQSSPVLAAAPADPGIQEASVTRNALYEGHLYRNGGYFGEWNSDVELEHTAR